MALQKNFLKPSIEQLPIPKWHWILNIVVHIGLAFTFYLFAMYLKEMYKYEIEASQKTRDKIKYILEHYDRPNWTWRGPDDFGTLYEELKSYYGIR